MPQILEIEDAPAPAGTAENEGLALVPAGTGSSGKKRVSGKAKRGSPTKDAPATTIVGAPVALGPAGDAETTDALQVENLGSLQLALPEVAQNLPLPVVVKDAGFRIADFPKCDTEYAISGMDMQVLHLLLKPYQEISAAGQESLVYRSPSIAMTRYEFGVRYKNMTGDSNIEITLAPGYIAKVVPLSLTDYPELIIKPEVFLASLDAGLRVDDELRPGFLPYKALRGTGLVFLKTVGTALFHVLGKDEAILANTPNVLAFQTFCTVEDRTVEGSDKPVCACFGQKPARVFPHMHIRGPGLVALSQLFPDAKIIPVSLEEFPDLFITHEVFMVASDPYVEIYAERMRRGKETHGRGMQIFHIRGKGVVFLNVCGAIKFQILKPLETILASTLSIVGYQGSCKVTQEKAASVDRKWLDVRLNGPGLVMIQSLPSQGRKPERWGPSALRKQAVVKKPKEDPANAEGRGSTPGKPQAAKMDANSVPKDTE